MSTGTSGDAVPETAERQVRDLVRNWARAVHEGDIDTDVTHDPRSAMTGSTQRTTSVPGKVTRESRRSAAQRSTRPPRGSRTRSAPP